VSVAAGHGLYERSRVHPVSLIGSVASAVALLAVAAFMLGRALAPAASPRDPIENASGIPIGVDHSPAGALAAADNYVAVSYDSVERNAPREAQLINAVYAPAIRASAISGATAVRARNPASMRLWARGGQNLSLIGARRLDYYRGDTAQVSTWDVDVFWGPGRPPKQAWVLTQTSLRWIGGRWLVAETETLPTAGAVPALTPQATPSNDSATAFGTDLAGFSAPSYGAAG
jgi:hypothetical protein